LLLLALPWLFAQVAGASGHPAREARKDLSLQQRQRQMRRIDKTIRKADVRDAKRRVFGRQPWARADVRSLTLLDEALTATTRDEVLARARRFLDTAALDGERSFVLELDLLDAGRRTDLARELGCDGSPEDPALQGDAARDCILALYREDARMLLAAQMDDLRRADGLDELTARLEALRDGLRPSIKTRGKLRRRILTAPAFPAVWAWRKSHSAHEYEGPQWIDYGDRYRLFAPELSMVDAPVFDAGDGTRASLEDTELLSRFAPVVVQEVAPPPSAEEATEPGPDAPYPPETDRIGSFALAPDDAGKPRPVVDTERPASYAYVDRLPLHGRELTQLVYTFWYPEHPKLKPSLDVEAGEIEGITLRITLDPAGTPRLFETVYNCGCSHRLFVDRELEQAAAAELGPPEGDRPYSIQRAVDGRIDWIVPELVDRVPGARPMLFVRSGFHMPATVRFALPEGFLDGDGEPRGESEGYELHAYRELERLPWGDGWASLFNDKGLVRGARRLEGLLLMPLGLLQAGQPRQRGTQLIHFDQADFDDPAIYDTYLRLPESFFQGSIDRSDAGEVVSRYTESGRPASRGPERSTSGGNR